MADEQWALEPHPVVFIDKPDSAKLVAWARGCPRESYFTDSNPRTRFVRAAGWGDDG